jgi:hypothetical protein
LVELLPVSGQLDLPGRKLVGARDKRYFQAVMLLACLALGAAVLSSML